MLFLLEGLVFFLPTYMRLLLRRLLPNVWMRAMGMRDEYEWEMMWPPKGKGVPAAHLHMCGAAYDRGYERETPADSAVCLRACCWRGREYLVTAQTRCGRTFLPSRFFFAFFQPFFHFRLVCFFTMRLLFGRDSALLRRLVYYLYRVNI